MADLTLKLTKAEAPALLLLVMIGHAAVVCDDDAEAQKLLASIPLHVVEGLMDKIRALSGEM